MQRPGQKIRNLRKLKTAVICYRFDEELGKEAYRTRPGGGGGKGLRVSSGTAKSIELYGGGGSSMTVTRDPEALT